MRFEFIRPTAPNFKPQMQALRPAFDGSDMPRAELEDVTGMVRRREADLYRLTGEGIQLWLVGRVMDETYHIVAVTGRGLSKATEHIIQRVKACGYCAITYHTYRPGMRRILNRFGFEQVELVREFDGKQETIHRLTIARVNGTEQ
ncbi:MULTISPECIES: hypothetical protein [Photobacterium]|uniref:hypothetical protein n=1 Tax=Photobacterium TaxID=657 RepID=UPI001C2CF074|nr:MULTISPECIES: hypothetical protein [Photobacterium]MBV1843622.1 hypothetical protein [Photobacterium ganghwense]